MHLAKVRWLQGAGWKEYEIYPMSGITIMVRDGQILTVLKNGRVNSGNHGPK
jgi:hypothetical protein